MSEKMAGSTRKAAAPVANICLCCSNHSATLLAACNCTFVSIMSVTLMIVYRFLYNVPWHSFEVMSTLLLTVVTFSLFVCVCSGAVLRNQVLLSVWVVGFSLVTLYIGFTMVSTFVSYRIKRRGILPPMVIAELMVLLFIVLTSLWCIAAVIARICEMHRGLYYYDDEYANELPFGDNHLNTDPTESEKEEVKTEDEKDGLAYDQYELVRSAFHCEPGQVPRCEQTRQIWTRQATALYENDSEAPLLAVNFPTFRNHQQQQRAMKIQAHNSTSRALTAPPNPSANITNTKTLAAAPLLGPTRTVYVTNPVGSSETTVKYAPIRTTASSSPSAAPFRSNNSGVRRQYVAPVSYASPSPIARNIRTQRTQFVQYR